MRKIAKVQIKGTIIPNDYKWYYDLFDMDSTAPKDVQTAIDAAGGAELEVYINSGGGSIDAGSEIYTLLRSYQGGIKIYITGVAHSAASVIAMAGYSEMSPTALMMVHCVSVAGVSGNHNELQKRVEMLEAADQALCTAYMEKAGMTQAQALELMEKETWLTAEQAKNRGMVDKVMFEGTGETAFDMVAGTSWLPSKEQMEAAKNLVAKKEETVLFDQEKAQAALNLLSLGGK